LEGGIRRIACEHLLQAITAPDVTITDAACEAWRTSLIIAAILAMPYSLDYDMTALAIAIAFLAAHGLRCGFAPWEMAAVLGLVLQRAISVTGSPKEWHSAQYPIG
jgi:hypothetical protein